MAKNTFQLGIRRADPAVKVVLLGQSGVGKTSLATQLTHTPTSPSPPTPTVGLDFMQCSFWVDDCRVCVNLWDTAGQERFHSLLPTYCRGAQGVILMFDLTDLHSFLGLHTCLHWAEETLPDNTCKLLVGNKRDLAERGHRAVTSWMAREWAEQEGADYVEMSMTDNSGSILMAVFTSFLRCTLETHVPHPAFTFVLPADPDLKVGCCS